MTDYLPIQKVRELTDAILSGGLNTPTDRDALLAGINRGYVAALPMRRNTLDQIESDLVAMNGVPYLTGYEVPLKTWLENVVHKLRARGRSEQALFQEALNDVAAKSEDIIREAQGIVPIPSETKELERIIHQDDLLAYGWLKRAMTVSASVARLIVTRYENGHKVTFPGSAQPIQSFGTGWLIGKQYIITNHHVINARSEGEPNSSESDLRKQAENTIVQFDYDSENAAGVISAVESLSTWVEWNATPDLDFAILQLEEPSPRTPLLLAPQALQQAGEKNLPVNIIQYPGGNPKSLGVRNNLISSLDEWQLRYFTDTMRGSSGSPVCNDNWQVIALHKATKYIHKNLNFQGKSTAWVNRGVRIDRIIEHIKTNHQSLWTAIDADLV